MKLENGTRFPAKIVFGGVGRRVNGALLVARATFRLEGMAIVEDGWPIFTQPFETEHGTYPPDFAIMRRGCDLVITGEFVSLQPVTRAVARARVNSFTSELVLFGDRRWQKKRERVEPSEPEPFTVMPLAWSRAFGGEVEYEGHRAQHPLNPLGRGFILSLEEAEGSLLPNIENPRELIQQPQDSPIPIGWGPIANAPAWQTTQWLRQRAAEGSMERPSHDELRAHALRCFAGSSPPNNSMPATPPGADVSIELGETRMAFRLPTLSMLVEIQVGADRTTKPLSLSGVWILIERALLVLTYFARFRYPVRPRERRVAVLKAL